MLHWLAEIINLDPTNGRTSKLRKLVSLLDITISNWPDNGAGSVCHRQQLSEVGDLSYDSIIMARGVVFGLAILCGLLARAAGAQPEACDARDGAVRLGYERFTVEEWPREAERARSHRQDVVRAGAGLRLGLETGGTVELTDCPYGDKAHVYLFERYDEAGRFYVVRALANEDFSYRLVTRKTGQQFTVHGTPVWTQDKSRFLTVACSLLPERGKLTVHVPDGDAIKVEGEAALPCERESCSARWDHAAWISVSCTPRDEESQGKRGSEFVLLHGKDGWRRFGR